MKTSISVESISCSHCCNFIHKELGVLQGVFGVNVDIAKGEVTVEHTEEVKREELVAKLTELGYSEKK